MMYSSLKWEQSNSATLRRFATSFTLKSALSQPLANSTSNRSNQSKMFKEPSLNLLTHCQKNGLAVVNDDFEYIRNRQISNVKTLRYGIRNTENANFTATEIEYDEYGTHFTVCGEGKELRLDTKLVGECNISNLIGAVIVAMKLGVSDEKIKYAVSKIEQVEHRLNMKRTPGGVTIIDDAFNSNPDGSKMALDVLSPHEERQKNSHYSRYD